MLQKTYFSEEPDRIRYRETFNGFADVWLRTNIESMTGTDEEGNSYTFWQADENYFRVKARSMPLSFVEENFDTLLTMEFADIDDTKPSLEQRISDLESIIAELLYGGELSV